MGAVGFTARGKGSTLESAFRQAYESAAWEYGHGGYTGTIAEKTDAVEFPLPQGVNAEDFAHAVFDAAPYWTIDHDKGTLVEVDGKTPEYVTNNSYPLATWRRVVKIADDKWGPAAAVRVGPDEFYFFGIASS
jgi:hypothetical protein